MELNARPFLTRYNLEIMFEDSRYDSRAIREYLDTENQALIARKLNDFVVDDRDFEIIRAVLDKVPSAEQHAARIAFRRFFNEYLPRNYVFDVRA